MVYKNKGVSQVYYGDKRIREIWLGNKRIFGSPFVHLYDNFFSEVNTGEWLLAGGILYRRDKGKDNWHISARGVPDIMEITSDIAALKDGNLHFSTGTASDRYLANAVDSGWSRLWTQLRVSMGDVPDDITIGLDVNGRMKAYTSRLATSTITLPDTRFKKPGISVDGQWRVLSGHGSYIDAVVYSPIIRSNVIDFSGDTYFNTQGEVRIRESDESMDRLVTTLSGTDIKFLSDTEFLHDGFIYTIGTDSFSKSDVGGFTDIGYTAGGERILCGIRDGVICKLDGSVLEGSPENVTDLTDSFALTSDCKVYALSSGSAVLCIDLKEVPDA